MKRYRDSSCPSASAATTRGTPSRSSCSGDGSLPRAAQQGVLRSVTYLGMTVCMSQGPELKQMARHFTPLMNRAAVSRARASMPHTASGMQERRQPLTGSRLTDACGQGWIAATCTRKSAPSCLLTCIQGGLAPLAARLEGHFLRFMDGTAFAVRLLLQSGLQCPPVCDSSWECFPAKSTECACHRKACMLWQLT